MGPQSTFSSWLPKSQKYLYLGSTKAILSTTTDAAGRFTIAGAGADRSISLQVSGLGVATFEALVVNREGLDLSPYNQAAADFIQKIKTIYTDAELRELHGPNPSLIAEADRPIRGAVKDLDSGRPRAGVEVWLSRIAGQLSPTRFTAVTDATGRYEIRGVKRAGSYTLEVPSDVQTGFLPAQVRTADKPGHEPIIADIGTKKGIVITGRVLDAASGKSLPATVDVHVLADNPFVDNYPEFLSSGASSRQETDAKGVFRIVTIPGPVVLSGISDTTRMSEGRLAGFKYKPATADPEHPKYFQNRPVLGVTFNTPTAPRNSTITMPIRSNGRTSQATPTWPT
jgi:hypothetical protein